MATAMAQTYAINSSRDTAEVGYLVSDASTAATARAYVLANAASTFDGKNLDDVRVAEVKDNGGFWQATVTYQTVAAQTPAATGADYFEFDTSGDTAKITNSIQTLNSYGTTPPDFKTAVNVDDTTVNGVDVEVRAFNFTFRRYIDDADFDSSFLQALYTATKTQNSASVTLTEGSTSITFAAGELFLRGVRGTHRRGNGDWELAFSLSAIPNRTTFDVGDITVATKDGWDYLWAWYKKVYDATAKRWAVVPAAVYVEQVYDTSDLNTVLTA